MAAVQAFKTHRVELIKVTESALAITTRFLSNEVIPDATKSRIIASNLPQSEKSEALFDAIEARILVDAQAFHSIVKLLEGEEKLVHLAKKLHDSFRE